MRRHAKAIAAISALLLTLALGASHSSASTARLHLSAFGAGSNPRAIAIDQSNGDVYVVDPSAQVVRKFDAGGDPSAFSALSGSNAIDGSNVGSDADQTPTNEGFSLDGGSQVALDPAGNVYLADAFHNLVQIFAASGAYLGQLSGLGSNPANPTETWSETFAVPCGIAFDPAGNLYVATSSAGTINRYAPAGNPVADTDFDARIEGLPFGTCGLTADSTGAVYSLLSGSGSAGALTKYAASDFGTSAPTGTAVAPSATAAAANPTDDSAFVDEGSGISHLDSAGTSLEATFGSAQLSESHGLGVRASTDRVYASSTADAQVHVFGAPVTVPDVVTGSASAIEEETATLNGTVDPDGAAVTDCHFEYGTDTGYGQSAPCAPAPGAGGGAVAVSADISGLDAGAVYHFRLSATNANTTVVGIDAAFAADAAPAAQTLFAGGPAGPTSATLAGKVDPQNQPGVTYFFEWGTDMGYGNVVPASPVALGFADSLPHPVTASIAGLQPGATYHFRVVAEGTGGRSNGIDRAFTTSTGAPADFGARRFERVSPAEKNGQDIVARFRRVATDSGDRIVFSQLGTAVGSNGGGALTGYVAERDPTYGWSARVDDPTFLHPPAFASLLRHSSDLTTLVVRTTDALAPDATQGELNIYLRRGFGGAYQLINPKGSGGLTGTISNGTVVPVGTSADFSHVLIQAERAPQTGPVPAEFNTYEWVDGDVRLVNVLPSGQPSTENGLLGADLANSEHAVSRDGSRIFWHTNFSLFPMGQIYVRENGTTTRRVTASQRTDCAGDPSCDGDGEPDPAPDPAGTQAAYYLTAEADRGEAALFLSCEKLTDDSTAHVVGGCGAVEGDSGTTGRDLYRYNVETGELEDLTTGDPDGADVLGMLGASDSLERIYFAAAGVLDAGAVAGEPNLYLWENGATRFIGVLDSAGGERGDGAGGDDVRGDTLMWSGSTDLTRTALVRVSADGGHLLFTSRARLTSYDNSSSQCYEGRCEEVYLYDAEAADLTCVSCSPIGLPPTGSAHLGGVRNYALGADVWDSDPYPHDLGEDGSHAFFESPEALVSADSNGAYDVYEWRGGEVRLVSSGAGGDDARFVDASADGRDVFFLTRNTLIGSDKDQNIDLYDARINGGFPEPIPPPACEGDACQSPPSPPNDPTPASAAFSGAGNATRPAARARCKRGKARHQGRCTSRKSKKNRSTNKSRGQASDQVR